MTADTVVPISMLAAALPTLFFVGLVYWVDRYEKEPWWLLAAAFLWGAVPSVIFALIANTLLSLPFYLFATPETADALMGVLIAPPVEESLKGLALVGIFFLWRDEIDSPLDGIIYGAMVGMGFAMVENFFYFVSVFEESGVEAWSVNVFMRALVFGLNHALFTAMTGLGIAIARLSPTPWVKVVAPIAGWTLAVFLHFLHNISVTLGSVFCLVALIADWGGILLTIGIIVWALVQERRWIEGYLKEEIALGTLTPTQYEQVHSLRGRLAGRMAALFNKGLRAYWRKRHFYHRCSELAYKKHHFELFQDAKNWERVAQLRQEIADLSPRVA